MCPRAVDGTVESSHKLYLTVRLSGNNQSDRVRGHVAVKTKLSDQYKTWQNPRECDGFTRVGGQ